MKQVKNSAFIILLCNFCKTVLKHWWARGKERLKVGPTRLSQPRRLKLHVQQRINNLSDGGPAHKWKISKRPPIVYLTVIVFCTTSDKKTDGARVGVVESAHEDDKPLHCSVLDINPINYKKLNPDGRAK